MRTHWRALGYLAFIAVGAASCAQSPDSAFDTGASTAVTPTAAASGEYAGHLFLAAEANWFTPCGSKEKWLVQGDVSFVSEYLKTRPHLAIPRGWGPPVVYVKLRGALAVPPTPGAGGRWERQITVNKVVEVRRRADDCPAPAP